MNSANEVNGVKSIITKRRRLSAPGRRKSAGIELKPSASDVRDESARSIIPLFEKTDDGSRYLTNITNLAGIPHSRNPEVGLTGVVRASGRMSVPSDPRARKSLNVRGPVRTAIQGEILRGYTCPECEQFAALLRSENVKESVIRACSRHMMFCAPTDSPPNLWIPWTIDSLEPTQSGAPDRPAVRIDKLVDLGPDD